MPACGWVSPVDHSVGCHWGVVKEWSLWKGPSLAHLLILSQELSLPGWMARIARTQRMKGNVCLLMFKETGNENHLFHLSMAFQTIRNREGMDYEGTRFSLSREFIPPPEGTSRFLGCGWRNHWSTSSWFQNCFPFEPVPTKQIVLNEEILLGSRLSSFSSPPPSSGCLSPSLSHRELKCPLWHHSIKSVGFSPNGTLLLTFSSSPHPQCWEHTHSDLKELLC